MTIYLSLGSNVGDREANLRHALDRLNSHSLRITRVSSIYESSPVGETPEPVPDYLNLALQAETILGAEELLDYTQSVESAVGRIPTYRWGPRVIDVDIL